MTTPEICCPNGCGFYADDGTDGRDEMNAHLTLDCIKGVKRPRQRGAGVLDVLTALLKERFGVTPADVGIDTPADMPIGETPEQLADRLGTKYDLTDLRLL